jgi:hypothetical protein
MANAFSTLLLTARAEQIPKIMLKMGWSRHMPFNIVFMLCRSPSFIGGRPFASPFVPLPSRSLLEKSPDSL